MSGQPVLPLQGILAGTSAVSKFSIYTGPFGAAHSVALVLTSDLPKIPCDAFVVPQPISGISFQGTNAALQKAGAIAGFRNYQSYIEGRATAQKWGNAYAVESGGGISPQLVHVACLGNTIADAEKDLIGEATYNVMKEGHARRIDRIVFPAPGIGSYAQNPMAVEVDVAARAMLESLERFWCVTPNWGPHEVIIAVQDESIHVLFDRIIGRVMSPVGDVRKLKIPIESAHESVGRTLARAVRRDGREIGGLLASLDHRDTAANAISRLAVIARKNPGLFNHLDIKALREAVEKHRVHVDRVIAVLQAIRKRGGPVGFNAVLTMADLGRSRGEILARQMRAEILGIEVAG